jgi:hypothetical protein
LPSYPSDRGLINRTYKELKKINSKRTNNPLNRWTNVLNRQFFFFNFLIFYFLLFICAYKAWVISPPCPHPLPYRPLHPLPLSPTPSIPSRNYFALIFNFVEERV